MKQYMLLLYDDASNYIDYSPEEMQKEIELHEKWIEELGDHYTGGEPLENSAKSVKGKTEKSIGLVNAGCQKQNNQCSKTRPAFC